MQQQTEHTNEPSTIPKPPSRAAQFEQRRGRARMMLRMHERGTPVEGVAEYYGVSVGTAEDEMRYESRRLANERAKKRWPFARIELGTPTKSGTRAVRDAAIIAIETRTEARRDEMAEVFGMTTDAISHVLTAARANGMDIAKRPRGAGAHKRNRPFPPQPMPQPEPVDAQHAHAPNGKGYQAFLVSHPGDALPSAADAAATAQDEPQTTPEQPPAPTHVYAPPNAQHARAEFVAVLDYFMAEGGQRAVGAVLLDAMNTNRMETLAHAVVYALAEYVPEAEAERVAVEFARAVVNKALTRNPNTEATRHAHPR